MERKNSIGQELGLGKLFTVYPSRSLLRFTIYASLFTVFVLLFALCSMPSAAFADKLVVKDTGGNPKFIVKDDGKVGMGTSNPETALHIVEEDASNFYRGIVSGQHDDMNVAAVFEYKRSRGTQAQPTALINGDAIGAFHFIGYDGNSYFRGASIKAMINGTVATNSLPTDLLFYTAVSPTDISIPKMIINSSGNVGIGTSSPFYKLDVAGDINTTGDIRKSGVAYNNPDYVFEPDYKLMSLEDLKKFVKERKHLPNMSSTAEIKQEGVKLFEQNRLMLEKLEEAYIYILKMEERISKLEASK